MIDNDEVIQSLLDRACSDVRSILNEKDEYRHIIASMRKNEWRGRWYMAHDLKQSRLLPIIDRADSLIEAADAYRRGRPWIAA